VAVGSYGSLALNRAPNISPIGWLLSSYDRAQMTMAMSKIIPTRASAELSCNATSIGSTSTAPVRLNDG